MAAPGSWGRELEHELVGWRRSAFPPSAGGDADLRLVFRAHDHDGVDILSFGLRYQPDMSSIYHIAKKRL